MFRRWIALLGLLTTSLLNGQVIDLSGCEKNIFSQTGEDGVLKEIFKILQIEQGYCIEFGANDGYYYSNTLQFRNVGWEALLLDSQFEIPAINLHKEMITRENALSIFKKYNVPTDFELMSIDIDSNDWYVWHALGSVYKPKVVIIEYNPFFGVLSDRIIKYDPKRVWDQSLYYGASLLAYFRLGRKLGYTLVYATALNAIFIRDDVLAENEMVFKNQNDVSMLHRGAPECHSTLLNVPTISSAEILN